MKKIGIDFGTTYSTFCYIDETLKPTDQAYIKSYSFDNDFSIPTVVAYKNDGSKILIGTQAKAKIGQNDWTVFQHFKMLLGLEDLAEFDDFIKNNPNYQAYKSKKPSQVAQDFFEALFKQCSVTFKLSKGFENLVITTPLIWRGIFQQAINNTAASKNKLKNLVRAAHSNIFKDSKTLAIKIKSEPEAAVGYFANQYRIEHKQALSGHVLVVDFGGGTLDITLAEVQWNTEKNMIVLSSLENSGKSQALQSALGHGGVAYDKKLLEIILRDHNNNNPLDWRKNTKLLNELEISKKQQTVSETLNSYVIYGVADNVFNIEEWDVTPKHCIEAFEAVNQNVLKAALDEVFKHNEAIKNSQDLKVVFAGGFSNLVLVEHLVRDYLKIDKDVYSENIDPRLVLNTLQERQFSIAKGAALVAANQLDIEDNKTAFEIGIYLLSNNYGKDLDYDYYPIIKRGTLNKDLKQAKWPYREDGEVLAMTGGKAVKNKQDVTINLAISDSNSEQHIPTRIPVSSLIGNQKLYELIPNWLTNATQWTVGFSSQSSDDEDDDNGTEIFIHFKNLENKKEAKYSLHRIKELFGQVRANKDIERPYQLAYEKYLSNKKK